MITRIAIDRYVYEDVYPAFKAATNEKDETAAINRGFLNYLAERRIVLAGDAPIAVADIGCGPGDTLIKYLSGVAFPGGFEVRATDFIPEYADAERGEALRTLAAAGAAGTIKLAGLSVRAGDAFGGTLLELLSGPDDGTRMRRAFKIVFASHLLYHAEDPSDAERLLRDVAANLLADDGICIMYHLANAPQTFQEYRARFGSQSAGVAASDTGAVTIDDPPALIAAICARMGLAFWQMEFETQLRFGSLSDEDWRWFKDPRRYDALADRNPDAYEDLKRLYFVVQRAPLEFAADNSASGLGAFIDEIRPVIEGNRGVLPLAERTQVFCRADSSAVLREAVPAALVACLRSRETISART